MVTREEATSYCNSFDDVIEDYPFHDSNWALMRHKNNKKTFACIYEREGNVWLNVKCDVEWRDFWRATYTSVVPAYHMNKTHWNSIILNGVVPDHDIKRMIEESYELTRPKKKIQVMLYSEIINILRDIHCFYQKSIKQSYFNCQWISVLSI